MSKRTTKTGTETLTEKSVIEILQTMRRDVRTLGALKDHGFESKLADPEQTSGVREIWTRGRGKVCIGRVVPGKGKEASAVDTRGKLITTKDTQTAAAVAVVAAHLKARLDDQTAAEKEAAKEAAKTEAKAKKAKTSKAKKATGKKRESKPKDPVDPETAVFRVCGNEVKRKDVLRAIAECDKLGLDDFLAKHKYRPGRKWAVQHEGKTYPPKAILGAAAGVSSKDGLFFNGGTFTTNILERLGFQVVAA